jgi:uncharacterized alkaline shock family protein YloU
MEGGAVISNEVLASYAADAAQQVPGVRGLSDRALRRRRGVRISGEDGDVSVELRLVVDWGASIPDVGREVQTRVREYLGRMADTSPRAVDVVIDEIGPVS